MEGRFSLDCEMKLCFINPCFVKAVMMTCSKVFTIALTYCTTEQQDGIDFEGKYRIPLSFFLLRLMRVRPIERPASE